MNELEAVVAGLAAAAIASFIPRYQHLLYRQPEYRNAPMPASRWRTFALVLGPLAGAVVAAVFLREEERVTKVLEAVWVLLLLAAASTDVERRLIPDRLVLPTMLLAAAVSWARPDASAASIWLGAAVGLGVGVVLFVLGLLFGTAVGASETAFGLGDVKLMAAIGLILGWPAVVRALFIAVLAAGAFSAVLLIRGRARSAFSYGPFLVAGALVPLVVG